ncbi:MAG: TIGR01244 family sulfur transferase [Hyphomicrobiaceae bacterium]|nr:TIGR01244 family sulfur transferase [Hyphomicrobiaceae bacterium]
MRPIIPLTRRFAVTGALEAADFAEAARLGYRSIICNLPDGELGHLPQSAEAARLAAAAGLAFRHVPIAKSELFSAAVTAGTLQAAAELPGPILAHCASGMRSAAAWGVAAARFQPADAVIATLARAGFNLAPLRDDLAALAVAGEAAPPALSAED